MKKLLLALIVAELALPVFAQARSLLNLDKSGVTVQSYAAVALIIDREGKIESRHPGFNRKAETGEEIIALLSP